MATAGPSYPGSAKEEGAGQNWTGESNITGSGSYATSPNMPGGATSAKLVGYNFGFALPNSSVDGIEATIRRHTSRSRLTDASVELYDGGVISGCDDKALGADWPTADATATYGGAADDWNASLTYSDVNGSDFGLWMTCINNQGLITNTPSVQWYKLEITYTPTAVGVKFRAFVVGCLAVVLVAPQFLPLIAMLLFLLQSSWTRQRTQVRYAKRHAFLS